jgi:hypothetical protein
MLTGEAYQQDLQRRINDGVREGAIQVVPRGADFLARFATNFETGLPLLQGMPVYRGSKDPDVDAGTFVEGVKHATPLFEVAQGYAETSNSHIGLKSIETRGIGFMDQYELPDTAVFHRNFGIEDASSGPLTKAEAEAALHPFVKAYVEATSDDAKAKAESELYAFCTREFYEVALPSEQVPTDQWVVQYADDRASRMLARQDSGPLAEVMIDVVRARKSAVDEFHAAKLLTNMRSVVEGKSAALASLHPEAHKSLTDASNRVSALLDSLRANAQAVPLASVREAIAWRKNEQATVKMSQLNNSSVSIVHERSALSQIPSLGLQLDAIDIAVGAAAIRGRQRKGHEALTALLTNRYAQEKAQADADTSRQKLEEISAQHSSASAARADAAAQLGATRREHQGRLQGGIVSRTLYRMTGKRDAEANMEMQRLALNKMDERIAPLAASVHGAAMQRDADSLALSGAKKEVQKAEEQFSSLAEDGALEFVTSNVIPATIKQEELEALATRAKTRLADLDSGWEQARTAMETFRQLAEHGFEPGVSDERTQDAPLVLDASSSITSAVEATSAATAAEESRQAQRGVVRAESADRNRTEILTEVQGMAEKDDFLSALKEGQDDARSLTEHLEKAVDTSPKPTDANAASMVTAGADSAPAVEAAAAVINEGTELDPFADTTAAEDVVESAGGAGDTVPAPEATLTVNPADLARVASVRAADRQAAEQLLGLNTVEPIIERERVQLESEEAAKRDAWIKKAESAEFDAAKAASTSTNQVASDEVFAAGTPDMRPAVPADIEKLYLRVGDKFYHPKNADLVAFEDKGNKLETRSNSEQIAENLVRIAESRGWDEIKVSGSESFRREAWLAASERGINVKGYSPSEQDKAALGKRESETGANKIESRKTAFRGSENAPSEEKVTQPNTSNLLAETFQKESPETGAQKHPELAGAYAAAAAMDKKAQADGLTPQQLAIVNARVRQNVVNSIERGDMPVIKQLSQVEVQRTAQATEDRALTR